MKIDKNDVQNIRISYSRVPESGDTLVVNADTYKDCVIELLNASEEIVRLNMPMKAIRRTGSEYKIAVTYNDSTVDDFLYLTLDILRDENRQRYFYSCQILDILKEIVAKELSGLSKN
jgi:hypothetical protein